MRRSRRRSSGKNVSAIQSTIALPAAGTTASTSDSANTTDASLAKATLNPVAPLSKHRPVRATAAICNSDDEGAVDSGKMDSHKHTASKRKPSVTNTTAETPTAASSFSRGRAVHSTTNDSTNSTAALMKHSHNQHHQQQQQLYDDHNHSLGLSSDQSMTESESDD
jgi:hypothetical protein